MSTRQGKVVFSAFAQQDPITTAQNFIHNAEVAASVIKELNRLPLPNRYFLHTLLESVINSYLDQDTEAWEIFRDDDRVMLPISNATSVAFDAFKERYQKSLKWGVDVYDTVVTRGCFPLHPITTSLQCSVNFQEISVGKDPRTILGFIFSELKRLSDQQAIIEGGVNWVLPGNLLDYYKEVLPNEYKSIFNEARQNVDKLENDPVVKEGKRQVLKALLLDKMAQLSGGEVDQCELIATMISTDRNNAERILKILADERIINFDDISKKFEYWSSANNPAFFDGIIKKKLSDTHLDWQTILNFSKTDFGTIPVPVPWGHQEDWQATEYFTTIESFQINNIRNLCALFHLENNETIKESPRGIVLCVARDEVEIAKFKQVGQKVIDEALEAEDPIPLVVLLPTEPFPQLIDYYKRELAIKEFSDYDRDYVGIDIYNQQAKINRELIKSSIKRLRSDDDYRGIQRDPQTILVPKAYRPKIQTLGKTSLDRILHESYLLAYRFNPPEFFTQYKYAQVQLRNAVKSISIGMIAKEKGAILEIHKSPGVARDLWDLFLVQKWQIGTSDYQIQIPKNPRIKTSWDEMSKVISREIIELNTSTMVLKLLNPPYGFDFNTACLLVCSWLGFNQHDLQLNSPGKE